MADDYNALQIQISANASNAVRNVNRLAKALERLQTALSSVNSSNMFSLVSSMNSLNQAAQGLQGTTRAITSTARAVNNMNTNTAQSSQSLTQLANAAQNVAQNTNQAAQATQTIGANAQRSGQAIQNFGNAARQGANNTQNLASASKMASNVVKTLKAGWQGFTGTLKTAGKIFSSIGKHTANAAKNLLDFHKSSKSSKGSLSGLLKELTRISKMLKLMITRMVLRKVIQGVVDGFKNLAQYSSTFDASISLLWNSFRQLGNSIAAAVSPLLNAFAPALNYIIQLCIKAVNAINQLISALTGMGTWTRAKTLTDSYAASLDKSNKSAKELKKTVLGFDELNQLQDNKNNGGGGTSPADMFEEAPISDKWKNFADWLKSMWDKADFTDLGKYLGEKILDALNKIPWNKIKAKAYKFGKSLATFLNGLIETPELGKTIGKSIAEAINSAVMFANGFVRNFHWDSLGKFIGETFNGFFENIDWYYIKDTVVTGMRGLAFAIQNFIKTFHWDNISKTLINAIDTVASGVKAFFENIDWKDLGKKFGEQLSKTIKGTDWKKVGEAIGDIIQAAIDFVSETLGQLSWDDIKKAIQDLLDGLFEKCDKEQLGGIIKTVLAAAIAIGVGKMALTAAKIALTAKIESMVAGAAGSEAVAGAATAAGTSVSALFTDAFMIGLSAFLGQQFGTELGKLLFPEDAELYDQYKGIDGFFRELKDLGTSTVDWFKMAWSGELSENSLWDSLSREEQLYYSALKAHYGEDFKAYWQMNVDLFGGYAEAWANVREEAKGYYDDTQEKLAKLNESSAKVRETMSHIADTKAAEGFKNLQEHTDNLKSSLDHIADSKARQGFAELHGLSEYAAHKFDDLADTSSKASDTIDKSFGIADSKAAIAVKNMQSSCDALKSSTGNLAITVEKDTGSVSSSFGICDTKAAEAMRRMKGETDKINFKPLSDAADSMKETVTIDFESVDTEIAGANVFIGGEVKTISKNVDGMATDIEKSTDTIKDSFTEDKWTFSGVWQGLTETFSKAKEGIKGVWNDIADSLNGNHEIFGKSVKINLPKLYAQGGFPSSGSMFIAGERGAELVGNINGKTGVANRDQITDGIAQAVYAAMVSANGSGSQQYINNTIQIDGETIARAVTKGQNSLNRRYSPTMA